MARTTTSLRLEDGLRQRIAERARSEGTTVTALVERYAREGLAIDEHPGIVFKPGPSGRRAALAGGPDVWEIISSLRGVNGSEAERIAFLADELEIHVRQVKIALDYAAAHQEEIESWIQGNDRAFAEVERSAEARKRLLG